MSIVSAFCPTPPSTSHSRSHRAHRTQTHTDPHKNTQNTNMRTFSISWCQCFYCCYTNWLVPPITAFCNKMCLINPYKVLREWQTNIKKLFLQQCIALLSQCFLALIAFVRMWKCSGGRAGDHQRTIRPKWGQLPGQVVQILCPRPRPQYTRPIYKTNIQD